MLNLGILASSKSGGAYTAWTKYANVSTARYRRITWNSSTAIFATSTSGVTESGYSTNPTTSITAGGTLLEYATQLESANSVVIAIEGSTGNRRIQRSTDNGTSWSTVMNTADTGDAIRGASYKSGRWVVAEYGDNDVWTSDDDGATWTLRSGVLGSALQWTNVCNNGTNYVVLRDDTSTSGNYYYSADGITWTAVALSNLVSNTSQTTNINYKNPIAAGGTFMAHLGSRVRTSTDGITWTTKINLGTNLDKARLAYGNGNWIAVGFESSTLKTYKSTDDGATWTDVPITGYTGNTIVPPDVTFYNNKFWIVDTNSSDDTDIFVLE